MPNKYLSDDGLQICYPFDNTMHHSQVHIAFIMERCKVKTIIIYIGILVILFLCATSYAKGQQTKVNTPKQPSKQLPSVKVNPDTIARLMVLSVNVFKYPRSEDGTKYGLTYIVTLAKSSGGGALQLPDVVVAPIVDAKTSKKFDSAWFQEMDRLGLTEVNPTRYEAIAMMKDINSRQEDYLARAKALTPELIAEWGSAKQFNEGNILPLVLAVLMIQHKELFKGGSVQANVSQNELKKLLSIPQDCANTWAATVSSYYKPIDAAFSLLSVPELFNGSTFNRELFNRVLPLAAKLVNAPK